MNKIINIVKKTVKVIVKSEASKQSMIMFIGNFVTAGIMGVAMIFLSRFMGPESFGIFSVSISIMLILSKFVDLGLDQMITRFVGKWPANKAKRLLGHILLWKIIFSLILIVSSFILLPLIANVFNYHQPTMIIWAIMSAILIELYAYVYLVFSARQQFKLVSLLSIAQALLKIIGFGFCLLMANSILGISLVYYVAPAIAALFLSLPNFKQIFPKLKLGGKNIGKEINYFWLHAGLGVIMMTLISNLDILLIQKYLNSYETGIYAGAAKISMFIGMITASIGTVLNNRTKELENKVAITKYLK